MIVYDLPPKTQPAAGRPHSGPVGITHTPLALLRWCCLVASGAFQSWRIPQASLEVRIGNQPYHYLVEVGGMVSAVHMPYRQPDRCRHRPQEPREVSPLPDLCRSLSIASEARTSLSGYSASVVPPPRETSCR